MRRRERALNRRNGPLQSVAVTKEQMLKQMTAMEKNAIDPAMGRKITYVKEQLPDLGSQDRR